MPAAQPVNSLTRTVIVVKCNRLIMRHILGGSAMAELTLESLAKRVEALEKELSEVRTEKSGKKDWRSVVGMFDDDPEFMQDVLAEAQAIREAERTAAR